MKNIFEKIIEFCTGRLSIMLVTITVVFSVLVGRLFYLQIVNGEEAQKNLTTSISRNITIPASRGNIYDRYGRPLATNQVAFSAKVDDSVKVVYENRNQVIASLVQELEGNGYAIEDRLNETLKEYHKEFGEKGSTEYETLEVLKDEFGIDAKVSEEMQRKILSLGVGLSDKNIMIISLINTIEKNGDTVVDELPISIEQPYTFLFDGNEKKEKQWKQSLGMTDDELKYDAKQSIEYLVDFFEIPRCIPPELQRKTAALRYSLYLQRYKKFQPVTVAQEINNKTVAALEEKQSAYPGVIIDTDSLRNYDNGQCFSHIIGYIRKISDTEYEEMQDQGYSINDVVGKDGIEKAKELELNGVDGEMLVEVDSLGRRISTVETKQPISGKDVFLTIDKELQIAAYNYLEDALTQSLITKLNATSSKDSPISLKQLFISMVDSNNIALNKIMSAETGEQVKLKNIILGEKQDINIKDEADKALAKQALCTAIDNGSISMQQMVLVLYEQGKITADAEYLQRIKSGSISPLGVINEKLRAGEIKPSDTNLDPCTGSVVVSDVNTGEVLAMVSYPAYDNNRMVNVFDNQYYNGLLTDPTTPLINRPLYQRKAPGSTFKMVTAIAGLESGIITPDTLIQDMGRFTKAGMPYAKCWAYSTTGTHGSINVSTALEVSCNYFFYELAYRMGNATTGNTLDSITIMNEYMEAFGLNTPTGVEIRETKPNMASPAYKEQVIKSQNPEATTSQTRWMDGDTIRAAIGQSVNNFTPANMNKYVATLANGGTRYKMHLIDKVEDSYGRISQKTEPIVENVLDIKKENLDAVFSGMLKVTEGTRGTLRGVFKDFPVKVAAKSGTAQENLNRSSHTWFVGFAPYENPQISVTVMIPFGDVTGSPAAVVAKNVIAEYMGLNYTPKSNYLENTLAD